VDVSLNRLMTAWRHVRLLGGWECERTCEWMNRSQSSRFVVLRESIFLLWICVFWTATIRNFVYKHNRKLCQLEREVRQSFINSWMLELSLPVPHRSFHMAVNLTAVGGTACLLCPIAYSNPCWLLNNSFHLSHTVKECHGSVSYCCCVRTSHV
jgi:hypothetical protein